MDGTELGDVRLARPAQKVYQRIYKHRGMSEGHRVVAVQLQDFTLRYHPVMFPCSGDRGVPIVHSVNDQHRPAILLKYGS